MSGLPNISVALTTLNRLQLLERTLRLLQQNLKYSGQVQYVIGNDGEVDPLLDMVNRLPFATNIKVIGDGTRHGLGGNANRTLETCGTEIVLQIQDDYHLVKELNLDSHVQTLLDDDTAGWIRLRLIAGQRFTATVKDRYWRVSWQSDESYIASDQPHLKNWRRWHTHYGMYPEGLNIAGTENTWCSNCKQIGQTSGRKLDVLIPTDSNPDTSWVHAGDDVSWQPYGY